MLDTLLRMVKLKIYGKRFIIPFLLIFLVLAIVFCNLLPLENKSLVAIELETDSNSIFQIFWAGKDSNGSIQQYTEKQSFPFHIYQNKNNYHFLIPDLTSILRLRIDPWGINQLYWTRLQILNDWLPCAILKICIIPEMV